MALISHNCLIWYHSHRYIGQNRIAPSWRRRLRRSIEIDVNEKLECVEMFCYLGIMIEAAHVVASRATFRWLGPSLEHWPYLDIETGFSSDEFGKQPCRNIQLARFVMITDKVFPYFFSRHRMAMI